MTRKEGTIDYSIYLGRNSHVWHGDTVTPAQSFMMTKSAQIMFSSGSVRSGKTIAVAQRVIAHCLAFPGARAGVFRFRLSDMKNSTMISFLELIDPAWVASFDLKDFLMVLKNGSQILFKQAADVDSLGSMEFSIIAIDEAVQVPFPVFNQLVGRLSLRVSRPPGYKDMDEFWKRFVDMQLDFNTLVMVCNPRGRDHYLYKAFIDEENRPENVMYQATSTIENTALQPSYVVNNLMTAIKGGFKFTASQIEKWVLKIRSGKMPLNAISKYLTVEGRRLFLGEWVNSDKAIFDGFDPSVHCTDSLEAIFGSNHAPVDYDDVIAAADFGYAHPRIVVLGVTLRDTDFPTYAMLGYWAGKKKTVDVLVDKAFQMCEHFGASAIYLPPDDPGAIAQFRVRFDGCTGVMKAKNSVLAGITTIQHVFNNNRITIYNDGSKDYQVLEEELSGYTWEEDKNGVAIDKPVKSADHFPDALRYAIFSYQYNKSFTPMPEETETYQFGGMTVHHTPDYTGYRPSPFEV